MTSLQMQLTEAACRTRNDKLHLLLRNAAWRIQELEAAKGPLCLQPPPASSHRPALATFVEMD